MASMVPPNPKTDKHAIVPDIHAIDYDYPTGRIVVNDSGAKSTAEAFFEVTKLSPLLPAIHGTTSTTLQLIQLIAGLKMLVSTSQDFRTLTSTTPQMFLEMVMVELESQDLLNLPRISSIVAK